MLSSRPALCSPLVGLLLLAAPARADTDPPLPLPRLAGSITLDGRSDEPAWQAIAPLPLTMHQPTFQGSSTERTEIRIAYDDHYLYAAGRFYDAEPSGIRANSLYRDHYSGDDGFSLFLDTFNDNETGLWFFTTPAGTRLDFAIAADGGSSNVSWNTYWEAEAVQTEAGWFVEVRIPFSSLGFRDDGGTVTMGLAAWRLIARKNEYLTFPVLSPDRPLLTPSRTQDVVLRGVRSQEPVYITPYVLGGMGQAARLDDARTAYRTDETFTRDAGLDVKYNASSNLTLDVTINTDFAQAEADDQQVNLTRYSLFFPEKRAFFQERAGIFAFDTQHERLFHSRRIGLHQGQAIPILGGARLVGRLGPWDVGFLDTQTARSGALPSENFGVLRLRRQVFNENSVAGGIVTSRIGMDGTYNVAYGLDGVFRLVGDEYLLVNWAQTFDDALMEDDTFDAPRAGLLELQWQRRNTQGWSYTTAFTWMGEDYRPDVGFIRRQNYTAFSWLLHYNAFPGEHSAFRRTMPFHFDGIVALRNDDRSVESAVFDYLFYLWPKAGGSLGLAATMNYEDLRAPLELPEHSTVAADGYTFVEGSASYSTSNSRRFGTSVNASAGTFYDGWRLDLGAGPYWNVSRHLGLNASYTVNRVRFPDRGQGFDAHILQVKTQLALNAQVSANAFVQYNSAFEVVTTNVRFRYNVREGNDLWIVYNEGLNTDRQREPRALPLTSERTLLVKYTYTFGL